MVNELPPITINDCIEMMKLPLVLICALLPAVVILIIVFRRDKLNPEPVSKLLQGVLWGLLSAFVASMLAGLIAVVFRMNPAATPDNLLQCVSVSFLLAGIPEELAKLICLFLFLRKNRAFDEHADGIVYAVCVGMGFAGFENVGYLLTNYSEWLQVGVSRALFAVPGHYLFAVLMGYYFSLWYFGGHRSNLVKAFVFPMLAHGIYDTIAFTLSLDTTVSGTLTLVLIGGMLFLEKYGRSLMRAQIKKDANTMLPPSVPPQV